MSLSGLADGACEPSAEQLSALLGDAAARWHALVDAVAAAHAPVTESWNFGGAKYGWSLRLKRKERIVLYLIPQAGGFLAGIVLGDRAFQDSQALRLPERIRRLLDEAPRYAEGRGVRLPVEDDRSVEAVTQLVALKMSAR